jgi:hypothetical protein
VTAHEDEQDEHAGTGAGAGSAPASTNTLGVLLVHGIGSQGRGDTLVHCTTALHRWMRAWLHYGGLKHGDVFKSPFKPDLVDTSIAEAGPDHPAQARIVFRQGTDLSKESWLIAESCWFETYRRPGFYEFMQWALAVMPVAIVVHFAPRYRRIWQEFIAVHEARDLRRKALKAGNPGYLSTQAFNVLKRELGQDAAQKTRQELLQGPEIGAIEWSLNCQMLSMLPELAVASIAGVVIQLFLAAVAVLAIVPGVTRSFAGWVQRKLSATAGDSFMFVTSRITGAAIFTRVKKDFEWLAARCDRVIILAHSQGAAVSYNVIRRQFWGGRVPEKLHALVTYGSGLRKLHDLQHNMQSRRFWAGICAVSNVLALLMAAFIALFLAGIVPIWIALPGVLICLLLEMGPLLWSIAILGDPGAPPICWYDYYASRDPVPNGPIQLVPEWAEGLTNMDTTITSDDHVLAFEARQREVVNWRSTFGDHTSYWSSPDDFVGRVANILADASDTPIRFPLDKVWLKVSRDRRAWRVRWLSRCRAVTGLACLAILFWPHSVLEPAATRVRDLAAVLARLTPSAWRAGAAWVPDWLLGAAGLAFVTYLIYLVAMAGWTIWEKQEVARFFQRDPHRSIGVGGSIFALAWLCIIAFAPSYASAQVHPEWHLLVAVWWVPITLAAWCAWKLYKSVPVPGTPLAWGRIALVRGEDAMADQKRDRSEALLTAKICFAQSRDCLGKQQFGSDEWFRAVVGETRAIEELTTRGELFAQVRARQIYKDAIDVLKRAGRDASEVESRLDRVPPVWPTSDRDGELAANTH